MQTRARNRASHTDRQWSQKEIVEEVEEDGEAGIEVTSNPTEDNNTNEQSQVSRNRHDPSKKASVARGRRRRNPRNSRTYIEDFRSKDNEETTQVSESERSLRVTSLPSLKPKDDEEKEESRFSKRIS